MSLPMPVELEDARHIIRGPKLPATAPPAVRLPAAEAVPDTAAPGGERSPSKSPSKAARRPVAAAVQSDTGAQDDLTDSLRTTDQAGLGDTSRRHQAPPPPLLLQHRQQQQQQQVDGGPDKPRKYIQLLSAAYPRMKSKLPAPGGLPAAAAAAASPPGAAPRPAGGAAGGGVSTPPQQPHGSHLSLPLAEKQPAGTASSSTPLGRAPRPRASILDGSPVATLIPASPGARGAPALVHGVPSPERSGGGGGRRSLLSFITPGAGKSSKERRSPSKTAATLAQLPSLARRSMPLAQGAAPASPAASRLRDPPPFGRRAAARSTGGAAAAGPPQLARRSMPAAAAAPPRASYAFGSRVEPPSPKPVVGRRLGAARGGSSLDRGRAAASPQRVPPAAKAALASASTASRSTSAPRMTPASDSRSRFSQHQTNAVAAQRSRTPTPAARGAVASSPGAKARSAAIAVPPSPLGSSSAEARHIARMRASDAAGKLSSDSPPAGPARRCASPAGRQTPSGGSLPSPAGRSSGHSPALGADRLRATPKAAGAAASPGARAAAPSAASPAAAKLASPAVPKLSLGGLLGRMTGGSVLQRTREREAQGRSGSAAQQQQAAPDAVGKGGAALASPFLGHVSAAASTAGVDAPKRLLAGTPKEEQQLLRIAPLGRAAQASDRPSPSVPSSRGLGDGANSSAGPGGVAATAKGLVLPLHKLQEPASDVASPPRHRRGEGSSPEGAAAVCTQLLRSHATTVCSAARASAASGGKPAMLVPRLDLTNLSALSDDDEEGGHQQGPHPQQRQQQQREEAAISAAAEMEQEGSPLDQQQLSPPQQQQQQNLQELLLLDHVPPRRLSSDRQAKPASSAGKRGSSGRGSAGRGAGSGRRAAAAREEPAAPPESFYIYESVMPAEETRTYEELRRTLLKCPGGHRLAGNLQGIWGCYQDARRNTEAMAFRGHRLLDQVSSEYCSYKRDSEQQLQRLQQERDEAKQDLALALTARPAGQPGLEVACEDEQVQELQHEVQELRMQLQEMHKALHKAAELHHTQQAAEVPGKAHAIATSATANILFQQSLAQQEELLASQKMLEDLKAALLVACGALKQTNYMDPDGRVRAALQPDTVAVLDLMIASTQAEATAAAALGPGQNQQQQQPQVEIQEVGDAPEAAIR